MNASLFTADRNTHIKIVVIALLAVVVLTGLGIRIYDADKMGNSFVTVAKTRLTLAERLPRASPKTREDRPFEQIVRRPAQF